MWKGRGGEMKTFFEVKENECRIEVFILLNNSGLYRERFSPYDIATLERAFKRCFELGYIAGNDFQV